MHTLEVAICEQCTLAYLSVPPSTTTLRHVPGRDPAAATAAATAAVAHHPLLTISPETPSSLRGPASPTATSGGSWWALASETQAQD